MFVENTISATVGISPVARPDVPLLRRMRPEKRVPSSRRRNPGVVEYSANSLYFFAAGLVAGGVVAGVFAGAVAGAEFAAPVPSGTAGAVVLGVVTGGAAAGGFENVSSSTDFGT